MTAKIMSERSTHDHSSELYKRLMQTYPNICILPQSKILLNLHSIARNTDVTQAEFVHVTRRVIRLILEQALSLRTYETVEVHTPIGAVFVGARPRRETIIAVSIPRAGDAMEQELRDIEPATKVGKILIQRDPLTKLPTRFYSKLPKIETIDEVILMDPMIATAGTVIDAMEALADHGVDYHNVILACFLTNPEAIDRINQRFPGVRMSIGFVDPDTTAEKFMLPGIGDFGDRYFGTDDRQP